MWQSYLPAPQLLSSQKVKFVYKKLLRNWSVVSVLATDHQLFQTFRHLYLKLTPVCFMFSLFPLCMDAIECPTSSLGWQNGQQPLLANEMWVPVLHLHQGASSSSLHSLWLNCCLVGQTTQCYVQEGETQVISLQTAKYFPYPPPAKCKWRAFLWKTEGMSLLCITWKLHGGGAVLSQRGSFCCRPNIMVGRLYLATWFGSHRFLVCFAKHWGWDASP